MDKWYQIGRDWCDRWWAGVADSQLGNHPLSHRRALLRFCPKSSNESSAKQGWYDRIAEIRDMSNEEFDKAMTTVRKIKK